MKNIIKQHIKEVFIQPPKDFYLDIVESCDSIIEKGYINLNEVVKERIVRKVKFTSADRIELIKRKNPTLITNDNNIVKTAGDKIIDLLKEFKQSASSPKTCSYDKADDDEEDNYATPHIDINFDAVRKNLFYNKDLNYRYLNIGQPKQLNMEVSSLQTIKIRINGVLDNTIIPVSRITKCETKNKFGSPCENTIRFCDVHINYALKCKEGHLLKKPESIPSENNRSFFTYEGEDLMDEESSSELLICSFTELKNSTLVCNAIFVNINKTCFLLVLGVKEEQDKPLDNPILLKNKDSRNFLDDIYVSLKKYLKEYHNIVLTNQNKYIGLVIMFICLNNVFYKKRMNALIVGESGSGKSVWAEFIIPLFTFKYKIVSGIDVTRNKMIGGKSNMISSVINSPFSAGYVATQDIIFAEECTNALRDFKDPRFNQNNNIFHMIKVASGKEIDIGIQGGGKVKPKASAILVGNLEQLEFTNDYKKAVARNYKRNSNTHYKEAFPLFKPIEYYSKILKDEDLTKAHSIIRQTGKDVSGFNYITRLPPAEQSRYDFFIVLEDDMGDKRKRREVRGEEQLSNPKRKEFIMELAEIFNRGGDPIPVPKELKKQINDWFNDEFYDERNNYRAVFGVEKRINPHLENKIVGIVEQLIWMNKLYFEIKNMTLTEDDKIIARDFLKYNYNTLSMEEASLSKKPFFNDYKILKEDEDAINIDIDNQNRYIEKKKKEEEELKSMIDGDNIL